MNREVIYIEETDRNRSVKTEPLPFSSFVGHGVDRTGKESIEKYVEYRIRFEKEIKKVKLSTNKTNDDFTKIVYLGKHLSDDVFVCYNGTHWELLYGNLNSGML